MQRTTSIVIAHTKRHSNLWVNNVIKQINTSLCGTCKGVIRLEQVNYCLFDLHNPCIWMSDVTILRETILNGKVEFKETLTP